ncbi:MAG: hypothetical protein ACRDTG_04080 [Pseudonocardiaceae bacterium]
MHLTGTELLDWIALRRVHEGGVAMHGSVYVHWGRKVPCYLPEVFGRLVETELAELLDVDCSEELHRMTLTSPGLARFRGLIAKRGLFVNPEQSSGDCSVPLADRCPDCGRPGPSGRSLVEWTPRPTPSDRPVQRQEQTTRVFYALLIGPATLLSTQRFLDAARHQDTAGAAGL